MKNTTTMNFDEVNAIVSSFCKARRLTYYPITLATAPEDVAQDLLSWSVMQGDKYAEDIAAMVMRYASC